MTTETLTRQFTVDEFLALPDDDKFYELIEGETIEMAGPSVEHGFVVKNLFRHLDTYLLNHPLGEVLNNLAFILNPKNAPLPDLAFVVNARLIDIDYTKAFPGPPNLAVEVVSRTDEVFKVDDKVEVYQKSETRLIWVINPHKKVVSIYHPKDLKPSVLSIEDELDGEDVLPGFKLPLLEIFDYPIPPDEDEINE